MATSGSPAIQPNPPQGSPSQRSVDAFQDRVRKNMTSHTGDTPQGSPAIGHVQSVPLLVGMPQTLGGSPPAPSVPQGSPGVGALGMPQTLEKAGSPAVVQLAPRAKQLAAGSPKPAELAPVRASPKPAESAPLPAPSITPPDTPRMAVADEGTADRVPDSEVQSANDAMNVHGPTTARGSPTQGSTAQIGVSLTTIQQESKRSFSEKQQQVLDQIRGLHEEATTDLTSACMDTARTETIDTARTETEVAAQASSDLFEKRSKARAESIVVPEVSVEPPQGADPAMVEWVKAVVAAQVDACLKCSVRTIVQDVIAEEMSVIETHLEQTLIGRLMSSMQIRLKQLRNDFNQRFKGQEATVEQVHMELCEIQKREKALSEWVAEMHEDHDRLRNLEAELHHLEDEAHGGHRFSMKNSHNSHASHGHGHAPHGAPHAAPQGSTPTHDTAGHAADAASKAVPGGSGLLKFGGMKLGLPMGNKGKS